MPALTVNGLTFVHIPKTAGKSVTRWIHDNFRDKLYCPDLAYTHPKLSMIDNVGTDTFAIVRNPWDRIVSLWAFWTGCVIHPDVPFDTFVRNLDKYTFADWAWFTFAEPQKGWIPEGVTHLLKFETLEEDFRVIQERLGCFEPLPCVNASVRSNFRQYYTDETRDIIAQVFKDDIEAFGYTF